jgi:hypothetical protein
MSHEVSHLMFLPPMFEDNFFLNISTISFSYKLKFESVKYKFFAQSKKA